MGFRICSVAACRRIFGGGFGIFKTENPISQIALRAWKFIVWAKIEGATRFLGLLPILLTNLLLKINLFY